MTLTPLQDANDHRTAPVPGAAELIAIARQAHSFQTRELLQRIVTGEQQRIRDEQLMWRIGGALVGTFLGLGDGFQAADIFLGMGCSSLAGLSHEVMSHEQRRFLENCHSIWTIGTNSPAELLARVGPARSRLLLYAEGWAEPLLLSHHQGLRGDTLIPLGFAQQHAAGFHNAQSRQVLQQYFNSEELQLLAYQLYPDASRASQVNRVAAISREEARQIDPHAHAFLPQTEPVLIETNRGIAMGYRLPIPVHSDF